MTIVLSALLCKNIQSKDRSNSYLDIIMLCLLCNKLSVHSLIETLWNWETQYRYFLEFDFVI